MSAAPLFVKLVQVLLVLAGGLVSLAVFRKLLTTPGEDSSGKLPRMWRWPVVFLAALYVCLFVAAK